MSEASIESNDLTFEVTRAGRRFPSLSEAHHSPPQNRIRQLQRQPLDDELPKQLSQAISLRLAWHELSPLSSPARETVATAYINSLKTLNEFYHDVRTVICEACLANLEFRADENATHVEARDKILGDSDLGKLKSLQVEWTALESSLLHESAGSRIAGSAKHLERFVEILQQVRPTAEQIAEWERQLNPLMEPFAQAASESTPVVITEEHAQLLSDLGKELKTQATTRRSRAVPDQRQRQARKSYAARDPN